MPRKRNSPTVTSDAPAPCASSTGNADAPLSTTATTGAPIASETSRSAEQNDNYERLLQEALDTGNTSMLPEYTEQTCSSSNATESSNAWQREQGYTQSLRYDGDDFLKSARPELATDPKPNDKGKRIAANSGKQTTKDVSMPDPGRQMKASSQQAILKLGYKTGLIIADNLSEGWVPGRQILLRLTEDPDANQAINECLTEIAEDLELDKYMNAGARLAAITLGLALEIRSAERPLSSSAPVASGTGRSVSSNDGVADLEPCAFDQSGRD